MPGAFAAAHETAGEPYRYRVIGNADLSVTITFVGAGLALPTSLTASFPGTRRL